MKGIKKKGEKKWKRLVVFLILLIVFGILLNSVHGVYNKKKEVQETLAQMKAELKDLEDRKKSLEQSLARFNTEEGIAYEMRQKLNVAEVGESVAIIVEEKTAEPSSDEEISVWQKVKDFISNLFK